MLNETFVQKLLNLIENGVITGEQIKSAEYRAEVQARLDAADGTE